MLIPDRHGHREKIKEGLEFFYQMADKPKPTNLDYLVKGWSELLKDVQIYDIVPSFKLALKSSKQKIPSVYQVIEASKGIRWTNTKSFKEEESEYYKRMKPSDFPTPEQHKKACKVIMATMDGKCDVEEGKVWLEKIFR